MNPQLTAALAELCKMGLQFGGALLIARLAVTWALQRYKAEKTWEREAAAFSDVLAAISELRRLNDDWIYHNQRSIEMAEDEAEVARRAWWAAQAKLRDVTAAAAFILPTIVTDRIDILIDDLHRRMAIELEDQIVERGKRLDEAATDLVNLGRTRLETAK